MIQKTLILLSLIMSYSLVNATPTRHMDTRTLTPEQVKGGNQEWKADLSLNYFKTDGNVDLNNKGLGLALYKDFKSQSIYLKGDYEKQTFFNTVLQNKKSIVVRYDFNKVKNKKWFVYSTYGDSVFSKLDSRITGGFGRWIDFSYKNFSHGLSFVVAREREEILNVAGSTSNYRWAIRDLGTYKVNENVNLGYDLFYIPKFGDMGDHRVFLSAYMQTKLNESISTKFSLTQEYDSNPPAGVKKKDTQVTMSLVFHFGK